jgi:RimJ/RimL family protein N-acetyltransferase
MLLPGEKVQLRALCPADFAQMVAWSRDEEVNRYLDGDYPAALDECSAWLKRVQSDRHAQHFAVTTLDGKLIGDIELDHITWRSGDAELRIRIGEKHLWDKGFGTDAVMTLLKHAFMRLALKRVYLRVYAANTRAVRCYEKAGFRKEGRLQRRMQNGVTAEIILMRILRSEYMQGLVESSGQRTA